MVLTNDGAEISWWSTGSGAPLLLIAGQATTHRGWLHVLPGLAENHRVILYDHRGTGRSTSGDRSRFTTRDFAQDAVTVLEAAGVESAAVYGHSMGGRVGQWLAIDSPERVERLALVSTTGGGRMDGPRPAGVDALLASGSPEQMAPLFFSDEFRERHPGVVEEFFARDASISARRDHFLASKAHDAWDQLPLVSCPTLIVHGAADQVTSVASAERMAAYIPEAELWVDPDAKHCPHLDSPQAQDRISAFFAA
ncbi:alpha/beta fold hydrolase [Gulosibacter chungangensis]|uniref:Alpha/beta fold hydrolase n=2 Tax=Gulosibacter chungangensis TaxID=979746 RepID=A0A7J5BBM4_9MICO|nr:alpha/beta fold hydrolase [Gulosibacter chungangensis]